MLKMYRGGIEQCFHVATQIMYHFNGHVNGSNAFLPLCLCKNKLLAKPNKDIIYIYKGYSLKQHNYAINKTIALWNVILGYFA